MAAKLRIKQGSLSKGARLTPEQLKEWKRTHQSTINKLREDRSAYTAAHKNHIELGKNFADLKITTPETLTAAGSELSPKQK